MQRLFPRTTLLLVLLALSAVIAQSAAAEVTNHKDLTFASIQDRELKLDLYVPDWPNTSVFLDEMEAFLSTVVR